MGVIFSDSLVPNPAESLLDYDNPLIGWHNTVNVGNVFAGKVSDNSEAEDPDYPTSNLANPNTYQRFQQSTSGESFWLQCEPQTLQDIDYVAIAGHNWGTLARQIAVFGALERDNADEPVFYPLISPITPTDDTPLIIRFTPAPYLAIRIVVESTLGGDDDIARATIMYVGKLLIMERKIQVSFTPLVYGRRSNVVSHRSVTGHFLGRTMLGSWTESQATFMWMSPNWYRQFMDPFLKQAQTNPFFFAWAPISYPSETGFAWLTDIAEPQIHSPTGHIQVSLMMQGISQPDEVINA